MEKTLRKILSFWVGPFLVGSGIAIGYQSTPRIFLLKSHSQPRSGGMFNEKAFPSGKLTTTKVNQNLAIEKPSSEPTRPESRETATKDIEEVIISESELDSTKPELIMDPLQAAIKSLNTISKLEEQTSNLKAQAKLLGLSTKKPTSIDGAKNHPKAILDKSLKTLSSP